MEGAVKCSGKVELGKRSEGRRRGWKGKFEDPLFGWVVVDGKRGVGKKRALIGAIKFLHYYRHLKTNFIIVTQLNDASYGSDITIDSLPFGLKV